MFWENFVFRGMVYIRYKMWKSLFLLVIYYMGICILIDWEERENKKVFKKIVKGKMGLCL